MEDFPGAGRDSLAPAIISAFETLDVGGLIVNDVPTYRADSMPCGGMQDAGLGREGFRFAIQELTESKVLVMKGVGG